MYLFLKVTKCYQMLPNVAKCYRMLVQYPLTDLKNEDKKDLSNNALTIRNQDKGKGKGKGRGKGKGKGRGRDNFRNDNFRNPNRHRPHQSRTSETGREEGKGEGRKGKASTPRTYGDRQPKDPCSYCGGDNHSARTCYKRQNDEKNEKSPTTHKQANLNVQIDETALMFQNSALTVFTSESSSHTDPNRWGESTIV